jgi:hypothetical protein
MDDRTATQARGDTIRRAACAQFVSTWRYFAGRLPPRATGHHKKEERRRTDLATAGKTRNMKGDAPLAAARISSSIAGETTETLLVLRAAGAA